MNNLSQSSKEKTYSLKNILESLENGSFRKIICGASNTSEKQVERLAMVYSLAGVDVIDISPKKEIYDAAKRGINRAQELAGKYPRFKIPAIMKSISVGDDKHFRKASFELSRCTGCLECAKNCNSGAISSDGEKVKFDAEKCYGCAICVETCQKNAVIMMKNPYIPESGGDNEGDFDAIEIHTGNSSIEEVKTFVRSHKNSIEEADLVSVSVETMRFNNANLIEYVDAIVKLFDKKIIIQADGASMRGGTKNSSTIHTIAAAATLINAKINAYIQLAGGVNHKTQKIVDLAELKPSGIGYGTFAKKNILSYIEGYEEREFMASLHEIVDIAVVLTKN